MLTRQTAAVWCDSCGQSFTPTLIEEPAGDGARQSFTCPHCGDVYLVATITGRGLALRRQLAEAHELVRAIKEELAGEMTRYGQE